MMSKKIIKFDLNKDYVCEILTDYDKLSERASEFDLVKENTELQKIVLKLKNTIRNKNLLGLSANQIGFDKRIICLNFNGDIKTFVNPIITNAFGFELSRETCSSIPEKTFIRTRNSKISITYQTPLGKIESVDLVGVAARVMQHHIDHLDGLLLSDVSLEIDDDFDAATPEEREEVINMYLDSLDISRKQIEQDIKDDKEAFQMSEAIRFMNSVQKGETVIESMPLTDSEFEELKAKVEEYQNKQEELKDE